VHKHEVRLFRRGLPVRSYRDSLGFRQYHNFDNYVKGTEAGTKLRVRRIDAPIYHYTEVRHPQANKKNELITYFYLDEYAKTGVPPVAKPNKGYDRLERFSGSHPAIMMPKVNSQNWEFSFDPSKGVWRTKDRIMQPIEDFLGIRVGEYRNYKLLR
jgi:hypothetical protein